jgi:preprotein translocase SecE subunit
MIGTDNQPKQESEFVAGMKEYFRGVRSEWGKITWPEKSQIISETFMVIAIIFCFTLAVFLIDKIYIFLFGFIK